MSKRWLLIVLLMAGSTACEAARSAEAGVIPPEELRALEGRVVFVSERDGQAEVYVVGADGSGERRLTEAASADYPAAGVPDGSGVLVVSVSGEEDDTRERMVVVGWDGSAREVGPASARVRSPSWSPDGAWLVFEYDGASFRDLYRIGADGTGLVRLTDDPAGNFEPAVSPDGAWIAFVSSRDGDAEVYLMRPDGSGQRRLTAFHRDDWAPAWSPDSRRIAFLSAREGSDRVFHVRADGTDLRPLRPAADTAVAEASPAWSPDGTRIAFTLQPRGGASRIVVVDVESGAETPLSAAGETAAGPAWSPDGRHLVYTSDTGIRLVRADGTARATLVASEGDDWLPRWVR
jgi:TolB protein